MKLRIIGKPFIKHFRFTVYLNVLVIYQKRRPESRRKKVLLDLLAIKQTSTSTRNSFQHGLRWEAHIKQIEHTKYLCSIKNVLAIKFLMFQVFLTTANLHSTESYSSIFPTPTIFRSLRTPTINLVTYKGCLNKEYYIYKHSNPGKKFPRFICSRSSEE